ncbi:MAG: hypothetical protein QM661_07255 [Solimonas sp.]
MKILRSTLRAALAASSLLAAVPAVHADDYAGLDAAAQQFKREAFAADRDRRVLDEQLRHPADGELTVFVAMDVGAFFKLDSVSVRVDGRELRQYRYSDDEIAALIKGGTQQLCIADLERGPHELIAVFTGRGPYGRPYRRAASLSVDMQGAPRQVELRVGDDEGGQRPRFSARLWP